MIANNFPIYFFSKTVVCEISIEAKYIITTKRRTTLTAYSSTDILGFASGNCCWFYSLETHDKVVAKWLLL